MNEIICPHCKKAFKIDEAGYADILKQVRNHEFEEELKRREKYLNDQKKTAIELAEERVKNELRDELNQKDRELAALKAAKEQELITLKSKKEQELTLLKSQKETELLQLKSKLDSFETEKALAVAEAMSAIQKDRDQLEFQLVSANQSKQSELQALEMKYSIQISETIKRKDEELKFKEELIERYKDMKAKLSTKMLGETLEQHCEIAFNQIRVAAFSNAKFGKDNDASSGTKGDYVFREDDDQGNEIVSIMFEMKNEADDTGKKQKIESFFKKLDDDRNKKKCEYAVLVTLLEAESDLYNAGIVDVSYHYPKMYVIRPQFFIPMITLLRNAALNSLKYKAELAQVKSQNIDITNFETELNSFKDAFSTRYKWASDRFKDAITAIDDAIKNLQSVKDNLIKSDDHLRIANQKAEDLSVKKLTAGNPTMQQKFKDLEDS